MEKSKNNIKSKKHVVILGGGLAGLSAAYELSKNEFQVTVIEMQDNVGGLARTIESNGFRFDTGPHRWYTKNDMVDRWMLDLMGEEIIKVPRLTRIYFDKKFFYYPIRFKNVLLNLGIFKATRSVFDYFFIRILSQFKKRKPITLEDGYIEKFGSTLYETFFKRYSEKLWGLSCKEVSSDWIGQRTRGFNITTIFKKALFGSRGTVSFVDEFSYPKKGIGRISEKLAQETIDNGGRILLNTSIKEINHVNKKIISVKIQSKRKRKYEIIRGDHFISTIPLSDVIFSLRPKVSSEIFSFAKKLSYRDQIQIVLFVNRAHIMPDTWIYVHPENISFMRVMEMDNWSKELSPKGKTSIVFEVSCSKGDKYWMMKDKDLIEMVTKEFIDEFQLITKKDVLGGYAHRVEKEYPVYHLGYKNDVNEIKKYLLGFKNFQIAGRNGIFRYNNMDHSIEMGLFAAWNIVAGKKKYNIESVNVEREYLEEKKIELPEDEYVKDKEN